MLKPSLVKPITTPSELKVYIDTCKAYILESNEPLQENIVINNLWNIKQSVSKDVLGLLEDDIVLITTFECAVCSAQSQKKNVVCVNPFTRAQFALLCDTCNKVVARNRYPQRICDLLTQNQADTSDT